MRGVFQVGWLVGIAVIVAMSLRMLIRVDWSRPDGDHARRVRRSGLPVVLAAAALVLVSTVGVLVTGVT
jgi:hypothetical protein